MALKSKKLLLIGCMPVVAVVCIVFLYLVFGVLPGGRKSRDSVKDQVDRQESQVQGEGQVNQVDLQESQVQQLSDFSADLDRGFFIACSGMPVWELASEISSYFNVNILVFDDIKDKKVFGDIKGVSLRNVLDAISWYLGCEYVEKDGIYYFGSNTKTVLVLPSAGLKKDIEGVFKDVTVKYINDKLVVYGAERDVARVKSVYDELTSLKFCLVRLYAIEISYDKNVEFGVDFEQSIKYAFSWENILENGYNPVQSLAVSLYASLQTDADYLRVTSLIDTDLGLLSGTPVKIQVGEDLDRPIYSQSEYGDRVISSYNTRQTGLLLQLTGSYDKKQWIIDFKVENSDAKSELSKTLTTVDTKAMISEKTPVYVLCKLNLSAVKESYEKGVPVLADIPFLGYLFRVSKDREFSRQIYFILALRDTYDTNIPVMQEPSMLVRAGHGLQALDKLFQSIDKPFEKK